MNPEEALQRAGGAARWKELIDSGVGRAALVAAVQRGTVVRRLYGTYSLPATREAVWLAAAFHAQLTCVSLCDELGLPLLKRPPSVHLLVPDSRGLKFSDTRPLGRIVLHRSDASWAEAGQSPVAAAIDIAAGCVDRYAQLALVDASLAAGTLYPGDLREFHHTPPERRRWIIDHCDRDSQSIMETYARVRLTRAGFKVRSQVVVGPRGHRDLVIEDCVIVELDGWETHGNTAAFREDRRLDRAAIRAGKPTLRYTFADLFGRDRADLVADVTAALNLVRKSA